MSDGRHRPPSNLEQRVWAAVRRIPRGRVGTYGDIAQLAGAPGAARAVGNIMSRTRDPVTPCHRVVAAGGLIGGYGGSESMKRELLRREGIELGGKRIRGFSSVRWPSQKAR